MRTREIKFRAWDPSIRNGGLILWDKLQTIERWWNFGLSPLMQFTGLKDKNGKEIYEGDIVIDRNGRKREVAFGKIGYDGRWNGLTGFGFKGGDEFMELEYHADPNDLTVVGNMWENPDLLTPNHNG